MTNLILRFREQARIIRKPSNISNIVPSLCAYEIGVEKTLCCTLTNLNDVTRFIIQ